MNYVSYMSYVRFMSYVNYMNYMSYVSYIGYKCRLYELYELYKLYEYLMNHLKLLEIDWPHIKHHLNCSKYYILFPKGFQKIFVNM